MAILQSAPLSGSKRRICISALVLVLLNACHRVPTPFDSDPNLPEGFSSPEITFETWVNATLAADPSAIRDCYWSGLGAEELQSWVAANLKPEARNLLRHAKLIEVNPKTLVEINFTFVSEEEETVRGVMVRTKAGWKIQSW